MTSRGLITPPSNLSAIRISDNPLVEKRKHSLNRLEIWFLLMVESIIGLVTFKPYVMDGLDDEVDGWEAWVIAGPSLSIAICCFGFAFSARRSIWSYFAEGVLVSL